ncbi:MAG: AAA family ATPase [Gemmatimonadaceae bacterium]
MLRLRSLGQCLIEAGDTNVLPAAETIFAVALYLIMESGRAVRRDELGRLLWPDVSESQAQHGLRQALYRLRSFGAKITTQHSALTLAPESFSTDFAGLLAPQSPAMQEALADQITGTFLPGYRPQLSEAFATWVERQRDIVHSAVARTIMAGMQAKKRVSDWNRAEKLAQMCLSIDPLNEEATLTVAEAAALGGSKTKALSILNHYLEDIGEGAGEIKLPAVLLRRRISEAYQNNAFPIRDAPFVGREAEMAELTRALARAQSGHGSAYVITGEPGIGKTRLLSEFTRVAALQRLHIVRVGCQSHDVRRPLSVFVDLVPKLLALPGALGCSPESMQYLKRLVAHDPEEARTRDEAEENRISYASARRAVLDLFDAVSSEGCIVLQVEDTQWLDPHSARLIAALGTGLPERRALLLLSSRNGANGSESISTITLRPLRSDLSAIVAEALVHKDTTAKEAFIFWCVTSSGGNPYYLIELLRNGTMECSGYRPSTNLTRLLQNRVMLLGEDARALLEACCILGKHSTLERVESCLEISRTNVLKALAELDATGMIEVDGPRVLCRHEILSSAVLSQMSEAVSVMLHRYAARQLELESSSSQSVSLMWESAEHWLAAADAPRALLHLRRCGNYLMDVGLPEEAARVLERAESLVANVREQYDVGAERARALVRSEQSVDAVNLLDTLMVLRDSLQPAPPMLDEVRVMYMLAKWDEGYAIPSLIADVVEDLSSQEASIQERVNAATWLLTAADNLCDPFLGRQVHEQIANELQAGKVTTDSRLACEMIYHCAFGDASIASDLADDLCAYAKKACPRDVLLGYVRYAAHVHWCHSSIDRSLNFCLNALDVAESMNAHMAITSCHSMLLGHALQNGDLPAARMWLSRATSSHVAGNQTVLDSNLLSYQTELAIRNENLPEARGSWESCRSFAIRTTSTRSLIRSDALEVQIKAMAGESIGDELKQSLANRFKIAKFSSVQDFSLEALLIALKAAGQITHAREVSSDFLAKDRRDRAPLSPYLRSVVDSISVSG